MHTGKINDDADSGEWDNDAVILGRDDVSDFNEDNILPQSPETLAKIRSWLRPTEYDHAGGEYKKHLASHLAGTGDWLFASDAYQKWHTGTDQGLLWIRGIPGSGKSVFAASIVARLRQEHCPVLYFFFRQIIDANHSPVAALRDFLVQLLPFSPPLQAALKEYVDEKSDKRRDLESMSSADLWRHLRQAAVYLPKVYCVVDALDEMDQTKDLEPFLQSVAELADWRPRQLKVVVTSRPVAYIEGPLRKAKAFHLRLEEQQVDVDIATYVGHKLSQSAIPKDMQHRIRSAVPGRANGLFLYAKLAMDAFLRPGADVAQVLAHLPQDLNVMYTDLLREHSRRSGVPHSLQLLILQAVTHASRPLRLLEIAEFTNVTQFPEDQRNLKAAKDLVRSACGPLLEILPDETVSVIHHSLTEFLNGTTRKSDPALDELNSYPILRPGPTHQHLALICLSYLLSGCLETVAASASKYRLRENLYLQYPFARYATQNWNIHARKSTQTGHDQTEVNTLIDRLLNDKTLQTLQNLGVLAFASRGFGQHTVPTRLSIAVRFGLTDYVKVLHGRPETRHDIDREDSDDTGSPLCIAAKKGYEDIVKLLLGAGASTAAHIRTGETPLLLAASCNRSQVAKILIEDGGLSPFEMVPLNNGCLEAHPTPWHENAVTMACRNGHLETITVLFPYITTVKQIQTALRSAVKQQRPEVLEILLRHPLAEVNFQPRKEDCPLLITACSASWNLNPNIIRLLLQAGADPNIEQRKESHGWNKEGVILETPLHSFAKSNQRAEGSSFNENRVSNEVIECFEMLVAAGADVNRVDAQGNSVLHHVVNPVVARLLLDAGADPNVTNNKGETLLHACADDGILQVLLADEKTNLEPKTECGLTPLLSAIQTGRRQNAFCLLERGADPNAVDRNGNGVFFLTISMNAYNDSTALEEIPRLIKRLRDAGADPNTPNLDGDNVLHRLVDLTNSNKPLVDAMLRSLVAAEADLESRDRRGRTPLYKLMASTTSSGYVTAEIMMELGAKLHTVDYEGRTLFHSCDTWDYRTKEKFRLFLANGLDPKQTDYAGNTLWHIHRAKLMKSEHYDGSFSTEISPLQPNHSGRTLLHDLAKEGYTARELDIRSERTSADPPTDKIKPFLELVIQMHLGEGVGVDQTDQDGTTPLHLASTHCEFTTRCLLEAGADPVKATRENLTPLHLAVISRRPNILALLLESLRSRMTPESLSSILNTKAQVYRLLTILQYACRSGQSESVRLLLDAGATSLSRDCAWSSCADFEGEDLNWQEEDPQLFGRSYSRRDAVGAGSVRLNDKHRSRPNVYRDREFSGERLDEIRALLTRHALPSLEVLDHAITSAACNGHDYTVDSLTRTRHSLFPEAEPPTDLSIRICLARRDAQRKTVHEALQGPDAARYHRGAYGFLMKAREYELATEVLLDKGLEANEHTLTVLYDLVTGGFASILKKVATREFIAELARWQASKPNRRSYSQSQRRPYLWQPLLMAACQTETPNMDVIRVLVEELGADINAAEMTESGYGPDLKLVRDQSVLHVLAQGTHWWQVAEALPYFLARGADVQVRDASGMTPLLIALGCIPEPSFDVEVIKTLVSFGADTNVIDPRGHSCLARAIGDLEITRFLLQQGARIDSSALTAAITNQKVDIVKGLLTHGADPNMLETEQERQQAEELAAKAHTSSKYWRRRPDKGEPLELYPLELAVRTATDYGKDVEMGKKIIEVLLSHGADPNAIYTSVGTTVMHRIIRHGRFTRLFLTLPCVDLDAKDSEGRTLLHTAVRGPLVDEKGNTIGDAGFNQSDLPSPIEILLKRGADLTAITKNGSTVFHALFPKPHQRTSYSSCDGGPVLRAKLATLLRHLASMPQAQQASLLNAYNDEGQTALHLALGARRLGECRVGLAAALLEAGASPTIPDREDGNTPLHMLLAHSQWRIARDGSLKKDEKIGINVVEQLFRRLISAGDANVKNKQGETPLFGFFTPTTENKPEEKKGEDDYERVLYELFEEAGMDFAVKNDEGQSLLHAVAGGKGPGYCGDDGGNVRRFQFLMDKKGLDPLMEDNRQRTALDIAAGVGSQGILKLFKRGGEGGGGNEGRGGGEDEDVGFDEDDL
ncbi:ankyrin [Podospora australis]|uniref:Ankyrin n=1 Tax=Podospora australis TaxID=1536484 RepID=A0AAN6WS22_9PEZI|nr:ankyrin [Podospora australis]